LAGGVNVIKKTISPHPQVELESLLQANPDLILKLHNKASVVTRFPSLRGLQAFQQNRVFTPKNMDLYLRPGPRIFLAAEDLQKNLKSLTPRKP
jgi:ABC-type Fe3+-hydroxamate transport system substrate-binding protein